MQSPKRQCRPRRCGNPTVKPVEAYLTAALPRPWRSPQIPGFAFVVTYKPHLHKPHDARRMHPRPSRLRRDGRPVALGFIPRRISSQSAATPRTGRDRGNRCERLAGPSAGSGARNGRTRPPPSPPLRPAAHALPRRVACVPARRCSPVPSPATGKRRPCPPRGQRTAPSHPQVPRRRFLASQADRRPYAREAKAVQGHRSV